MQTLRVKQFLFSLTAFAVAFAGYFAASIPQASALTSIQNVSAGDLIRGESQSAVYYLGLDGYRYVFPNSKTYFTWYNDFNTVKTISDADLATLQIGGNVTYRPGVRMIKIESDPRTYAVEEGGTLRHVTSEEVAIALYGSNWNKQIDDVPDGFFPNYTIGDPIEDARDYYPDEVLGQTFDINDDKNLLIPAEISITDGGFSPNDVTIEVNQPVRFTNNGSTNHNATSDDLTWSTRTLSPGDSRLVRFEEAGTYTFFNGLDSSSTGAIFVE
jgi:plastocyanin